MNSLSLGFKHSYYSDVLKQQFSLSSSIFYLYSITWATPILAFLISILIFFSSLMHLFSLNSIFYHFNNHTFFYSYHYIEPIFTWIILHIFIKDLKLSISLAILLILLRSKFFLYFFYIIFHNLSFMVTLRQIINCWFCKMVDQNHGFILFKGIFRD